MEKPEHERTKFKIKSIVTVDEAICMMETVWNLVLNSATCNACLSYRILAPYQELIIIIQDIKKLKKNAIEKARAIATSSCFNSEKFIFKQR